LRRVPSSVGALVLTMVLCAYKAASTPRSCNRKGREEMRCVRTKREGASGRRAAAPKPGPCRHAEPHARRKQSAWSSAQRQLGAPSPRKDTSTGAAGAAAAPLCRHAAPPHAVPP
jgi:hypothetical protein